MRIVEFEGLIVGLGLAVGSLAATWGGRMGIAACLGILSLAIALFVDYLATEDW